MSQFIGKTCPYCKTPFQEGDDVVICSVCEMPHHKECWVENQECTTFGCTGTIQGASAKNAGLAFCPYCGTPHAKGDSFCGVCGKSLNGAATPVRTTPPVPPAPPAYQTQQTYRPQQTQTAYQHTQQQTQTYRPQQTYQTQQTYTPPVYQAPVNPFAACIGPNADYYTRKFREMDSKNSKASWNWPAFLIAPFWCVYRKMYIHAAILFVAAAVLGQMGPLGLLAAWAGFFVFGLFANHLYREYLKKVTDFASHISEPAKAKYLNAHSGADMNKAVLICVIAGVVSVLLGL